MAPVHNWWIRGWWHGSMAMMQGELKVFEDWSSSYLGQTDYNVTTCTAVQ